ncbi:MAG: hypothetical protein K8S97_00760 [Anaerolineae bacterium]|nr:hypothetical protein [Anaerolineae bacterium]
MYNIVRRARLVVLLSVVLLLAGCIQPIGEVEQTKTAMETAIVLTYGPSTPTPLPLPTTQPPVAGINPTQPPVTNPTAVSVPASPQGTAQVLQFLQRRGIYANGLMLWYDQQQRADFLKGFSYTDAANNPCAGFVIAAQDAYGGWQATESGAVVCATQPTANAVAASFLFLTSDGQPHTIVFGRVQNPSVTLVSVLFDNGSSQIVSVTSGGFLVVQEGVAGATTVNGLDAQQNVILPNITLSPAA